MEPDDLRDALRVRGLIVLSVARHRTSPEILIVYLLDLAGQWASNYAQELIAQVPGVVAVAESVQTRGILLVQVSST